MNDTIEAMVKRLGDYGVPEDNVMGIRCVDTRNTTRGCEGISSKQWELGGSGVVLGVHDCAAVS
jgi:hypothetical protein